VQGFIFLVPAHLASPGKGQSNGCVCVCVSQKSAPEIFFRFLPEMTRLRAENKNMVENWNQE